MLFGIDAIMDPCSSTTEEPTLTQPGNVVLYFGENLEYKAGGVGRNSAYCHHSYTYDALKFAGLKLQWTLGNFASIPEEIRGNYAGSVLW